MVWKEGDEGITVGKGRSWMQSKVKADGRDLSKSSSQQGTGAGGISSSSQKAGRAWNMAGWGLGERDADEPLTFS